MKMSFEGELYYGAAGSSAGTKIENVRDVTINYDHQKVSTSKRGSGSSVPIEHKRVVKRVLSVDFTLTVESSGAGYTAYAALMAAMANGTPIAIKGKDYTGGKGPDFDAIITCKKGEPHDGEQTVDFNAEPTDESGRTAQLFV